MNPRNNARFGTHENGTRGITTADLDGRVGVITGAAGGIGAAVAQRLSEAGATVVLVDRDLDATASLTETLPGPALAIAADVTDDDQVAGYMGRAVDTFGALDFVHLNAGWAAPLVPIADSRIADFDRVLAVNVRGAYLGLRAAVRYFRGARRAGSVVVTSSGLGLVGAQGWGCYAASKHAVIGMVRCAALDHARDDIRINAICPGFVDTAMVRATESLAGSGDRSDGREVLTSQIPLGRYARPAEIAEAVAWLVGDRSIYVTGTTLVVDGGAGTGAFTPSIQDLVTASPTRGTTE